MTDYIEKLENLGYDIQPGPAPAGLYEPFVIDGSILYSSGSIPVENTRLCFEGTVGLDIDIEKAGLAARLCVVNILRAINAEIGGLDDIGRIIKLTGFVNSASDFTEQHLVMNHASQLLIDVFGERGKHARSAVGVSALPLNSPVEVEMVIRLKN